MSFKFNPLSRPFDQDTDPDLSGYIPYGVDVDLQNKKLSNARKIPRSSSASTAVTLTPEVDTSDLFILTALSGNLTIANHVTSVPEDGELLEIQIKDNGVARSISFGTNYKAMAGTPLPTTTTAGKFMSLLFEWSSLLGGWNLLSIGQQDYVAPYVLNTGNPVDVDLGAHNIVAANLNISNWNAAFSWGNHASAGYLTVNTLLTGLSGGQTVIGGTAASNDLKFNTTTHATKGRFIFGETTPTNTGYFTVNNPRTDITAVVFNTVLPSSTSTHLYSWRRNDTQEPVFIGYYGDLNMGQTNATGQQTVNANGNFTQIIDFNNSNTGVGSGTRLNVTTAGGAAAQIVFGAQGLAYGMGGDAFGATNSRGKFVLAGQGGFNSVNDYFTINTQGAGNAYETSEFTTPRFKFGSGLCHSADTILAANGNIFAFNANTFGNGLLDSIESFAEPSLPAGMTKWTGVTDCSVLAGGGLKWTQAAGSGYWEQSVLNLARGIRPNTYYMLTLVVTGNAVVSGLGNYVRISDPTGWAFTPVSIQHPQTPQFKMFIANGTNKFFFKTTPAAGLTQPVRIMPTGGGVGATFTITAASLKECSGGIIESAGTFASGIMSFAVDKTLHSGFQTWLIDATAAPRTVTLPTAISSYRQIYKIKKIDATANTVTVQAAGAELIDGGNTYVIPAQYEGIEIQSDMNQWWITSLF